MEKEEVVTEKKQEQRDTLGVNKHLKTEIYWNKILIHKHRFFQADPTRNFSILPNSYGKQCTRLIYMESANTCFVSNLT